MAQEIEQLILSINGKGFRVNNLFQLDDGSWQLNVRVGNEFFDFVQASSMREVLEKYVSYLNTRPQGELVHHNDYVYETERRTTTVATKNLKNITLDQL